ncbi:MAG TPA: O-antigen ligase family protein [Anaerolineales bacterium]|nr:O-antigen ligase family protein [Anaerolineales bacterium]
MNRLTRFLWGAALLTLPVTSFRYFPFLGDATYVRPLAFYPIAFLLPLLLIQLWRGKTSMPRAGAVIPLIVFVMFTLAATGFGALLDPLPLRGQEYAGRAIRAWVTLVIGLCFFIAAVWMNRDQEDLKFTVTWLMAGFAMDVVWSGIQSLAFYTPLLEKVTVTHWQRAFSMRELVRTNRVSGMAYEPAWLAGQIVTVYLPVFFASLLTGIRMTRSKWLEVILLGFGFLLLLATFSRGGLLIGVVASLLTFLVAGRSELRGAWNWFLSGFRREGGWILRIVVVLIFFGALAGAGLFLSQKGYITRIFNTQAESLEDFIIKNSAGARAAYTFGALGAYDKNPISGVGLGASGLYIYANLPNWAMTTVPEIARQLSPENRLYPTPKNMYARLLAETGLFGFILYFSFLFSVLGDSLLGLQRNNLFMRYLGIAGFFSLIAIGLYNNTQDSFATPNIWLIPGVVTGIMSNHNFIAHSKDAVGSGQENQ